MLTVSFFLFIHVLGWGGGSSLVTSNGTPPPRDSDVVHILVRHQEVLEKAKTETRKAEV